MPGEISFETGVFIEPLAAAYQVIKQVPVEPRMSVAVVGSGRLGLLIAQVLASTGCRLEVIGRNPLTLERCEKKGIMTRPVNELALRADRDVVLRGQGRA